MEKSPLKTKDFVILCGVLLVCYLLSMFMPGLSMIGILLMSAIVISLSVLGHWRNGLAASAVLVALNGVMCMVTKGGMELFLSPLVWMVVLSGISIGACVRKQFSLGKTLIVGTLAVLAGMIIPLLLLDCVVDPGYLSRMQKELTSYVYETVTEITKSLSVDFTTVEQVKTQYIAMIQTLLPGVVVVSSAAIGWISMMLARAYCQRHGSVDFYYLPKFAAMHGDKVTAIVFILSFLLSMILSGPMMMVFINLALITGAVMAVCGLSLLVFYIQKFVRRRVSRVLLYILILFIPSVVFFLVLLGLIDAFANLRHLPNRGDKSE